MHDPSYVLTKQHWETTVYKCWSYMSDQRLNLYHKMHSFNKTGSPFTQHCCLFHSSWLVSKFLFLVISCDGITSYIFWIRSARLLPRRNHERHHFKPSVSAMMQWKWQMRIASKSVSREVLKIFEISLKSIIWYHLRISRLFRTSFIPYFILFSSERPHKRYLVAHHQQ